jgi:hypothetical protein
MYDPGERDKERQNMVNKLNEVRRPSAVRHGARVMGYDPVVSS